MDRETISGLQARARLKAVPLPWTGPPVAVFGNDPAFAHVVAGACIRPLRAVLSGLEAVGLEAAAWETRQLIRVLKLIRDVDAPRLQTDIAIAASGVCRGCGCTDTRACPGGCEWVAEGWCSACASEIGEEDLDFVGRVLAGTIEPPVPA